MADTAGRQMGLPLYAVLKGKTMNIMSLLNALPGAVAQGLIQGTSATTLSPKNHTTRAQAAAVLMRFCQAFA